MADNMCSVYVYRIVHAFTMLTFRYVFEIENLCENFCRHTLHTKGVIFSHKMIY